MKTRAIALALAVLPFGLGWYMGSATAVAQAQEQAPQPVSIVVPKAYGPLKAGMDGVLVYEATDGTIRVMAGATIIATIRRN